MARRSHEIQPIGNPVIAFFRRLLPGRPSLSEDAPGIGLTADYLSPRTNPDKVIQNEGNLRYRDMLAEPIISAGLRHRDISYLFVSCSGMAADEDRAVAAPQLLPASDDAIDMAIWEFVSDNLDFRLDRGFKQVLSQAHQSAMTYGYAVEEILWRKDDDGKIRIGDICDRDPQMFAYDWQSKQWIYKSGGPYSLSGVPVADRKFWIFVPRLFQENYFGVSELAACLRAYHAKGQIKFFLERHLEKHGSGQVWGKYPREREGKQWQEWREKLLQSLADGRNQSVGILPEGVNVEVLESSGAGDLFVSYLNYLDDEMAVALVGNALAIKQSSVGSYASTQATTAIAKSELEQDDAAAICQSFNTTVIRWLVDWNFAAVNQYPRLQLIDPRKIRPIMPEMKQDTSGDATGKDSDDDAEDETETPQKPKAEEIDGKTTRQDGAEYEDDDENGGSESSIDMAKAIRPPVVELFRDLTPRKTIPNHKMPVEPGIFKNPEVVEYARSYMQSQPIVTRKSFDRLPKDEKGGAFTITALLKDAGTIEALHGHITDSLSDLDESRAWLRYQKQAADTLKERGVDYVGLKDLFISFRMARDAALNAGVRAYVDAHKGELWGLQYQTQDDPRVRHNHSEMDGVTRPVDDPVWETWWPPAAFGCRCWIQPITQAEYNADPDAYQYTQDLPTVWPDKGFGGQ